MYAFVSGLSATNPNVVFTLGGVEFDEKVPMKQQVTFVSNTDVGPITFLDPPSNPTTIRKIVPYYFQTTIHGNDTFGLVMYPNPLYSPGITVQVSYKMPGHTNNLIRSLSLPLTISTTFVRLLTQFNAEYQITPLSGTGSFFLIVIYFDDEQ
jgi:hypothetical protein